VCKIFPLHLGKSQLSGIDVVFGMNLPMGNFLFKHFFINILKITCPRFYFRGVTLLITPGRVVRQDNAVVPLHLAR
jgi:hypothetical protein